jgi:hypothetical protein
MIECGYRLFKTKEEALIYLKSRIRLNPIMNLYYGKNVDKIKI